MSTISRRLFLAAGAALPALGQQEFTGRWGLQVYSLRYRARKDLPGTLALIRKMGFEEVETSVFQGHTPKESRKLLDDAGLIATSMMAPYDRLDKEVHAVAEEAHTLGVSYVVASTLPQKGHMTMEECKHGAEFLNRTGEALARSGLQCCYHIHGSEFRPSPDGKIMDTLVKLTEARYANFEADIFWVVFGGEDPVKLFHRYPGRFPLLHVKDIHKDTILGRLARDVREDESVPLGEGIVDIPAALRAANETGSKHYYIEDEARNADEQIPQSLSYLKQHGFL